MSDFQGKDWEEGCRISDHIDALEAKIAELEKENGKLLSAVKITEEMLAMERERGAREMAEIAEDVCRVDVRGFISVDKLMQFRKDGRKK